MAGGDTALLALIRAIAGDAPAALRLLASVPTLASARVESGATRQEAKAYYLDEIQRHVYAGDTALHLAAAAYQAELVRRLLALGADVRAKNRRGAEPLHYALRLGGAPTCGVGAPLRARKLVTIGTRLWRGKGIPE